MVVGGWGWNWGRLANAGSCVGCGEVGFVSSNASGGPAGSGWGMGSGSFGNSGRRALRRSNSSTARGPEGTPLTLGLGGVAEVKGEGVGLGGDAFEAFEEQEVAILRAGDFDAGDETGGEEAGFQAGGAEEGLLGEGDALDGVHLLGVDGLVERDGVVTEVGDLLGVFRGGKVDKRGPQSGPEFARE